MEFYIEALQGLRAQTGGTVVRPTMHTVKLEISYRKPVSMPGDYLMRCWVTGKEREENVGQGRFAGWTKGKFLRREARCVWRVGLGR